LRRQSADRDGQGEQADEQLESLEQAFHTGFGFPFGGSLGPLHEAISCVAFAAPSEQHRQMFGLSDVRLLMRRPQQRHTRGSIDGLVRNGNGVHFHQPEISARVTEKMTALTSPAAGRIVLGERLGCAQEEVVNQNIVSTHCKVLNAKPDAGFPIASSAGFKTPGASLAWNP